MFLSLLVIITASTALVFLDDNRWPGQVVEGIFGAGSGAMGWWLAKMDVTKERKK